MSIEAIGNYRIISKLGAGGMGEVYRAHDGRLNRDVAIKILPESFASDTTRLARLQNEARFLAALQHPNIATIYGVEQRAIVMELVEGEELRRPLPLDKVLNYTRQIVDALEAAHDKGIVHRDLKPANIKVTPQGLVKVLDFGLAKAVESPDASELRDPSASPTLSLELTAAGFLCGTAAYMSPEQARCQPVDKRADIWAFGVILYEMISGRHPFTSEPTVADIIAAVVTREPDWEALPPDTPPLIRRLLECCLQKDPKRRLKDIGDARLMLEQLPASSVRTHRRGGRLAALVAAALLISAVFVGWWTVANRPGPEQPLIRLRVDLGPGAIVGDRTVVALSPDGKRIAFIARGSSGSPQIATRTLDQEKANVLQGTEGAADPFFSPDGQWIGFFAASQMKKVSVLGGIPVPLSNFGNARGAAWGKDHSIIVTASPISGLVRVPESGGPPETLTDPRASGYRSHRWPQILPAGDKVLFNASRAGAEFDRASIAVLDLKTRETKLIHSGGYFGRYLPTGHMIYVQQGSLFGVRMDLKTLTTLGSAVQLLDDVAADMATASGRFDFSSNGTFVYFSGSSARIPSPVIWVESSGNAPLLLPQPGLYGSPALSRDGRLAIAVGTAGSSDLHVWDPRRETLTRLTFSAEGNFLPVWSPDGKYIAYVSIKRGDFNLLWIRADGAGQPLKLLESIAPFYAGSFTPDGRSLVYHQNFAATSADILRLPLDTSDPDKPKPGTPERILSTTASESSPAVSPDGKWLAYMSNESGHNEVYVQAFPQLSAKWQVSSGDGKFPRWSPAGPQLFFETDNGRIMVADYQVRDGAFVSGKAREWTRTRIFDSGGVNRNYDVASDGKRLVAFPALNNSETSQTSVHVTFLFNFFDELKRRLPSK